MLKPKNRQFIVIFTLCGLAMLYFSGIPHVEAARGDGLIKHVQIDDADISYSEKSPERLAEENPRPKYERGLPTVDRSDNEASKTSNKSDSIGAVAPVTNIASTPALGAGHKIDYVAISQPVDQVMREMGQAIGIRIVAGQGVNGMVRKRHFKGEFASLMDKLAQEYSLFWFPDGGVVYVEPLEQQITKNVKLKNLGREQVYEAMDQAGMGRVKSRVLIASGEGVARVTGPESFQKAIESLLASLAVPEDPDIKIIKYGTRIN
jgi:hypothetical protein